MMSREELFLRASLFDREFELEADDEVIQRYIDNDWWIEFPYRALKDILDMYHKLLEDSPNPTEPWRY